MLAREQKTNVIHRFRTHESDTGSPEVQIAILSERIGPVLKAMGVGFCEQNQGSTISIEAAKAYRDMRILKVRTGIEP